LGLPGGLLAFGDVRRFTLITLIVLFIGLSVAAFLQLRAGRGERRFCGPGVPNCVPGTPTPFTTAPTTSGAAHVGGQRDVLPAGSDRQYVEIGGEAVVDPREVMLTSLTVPTTPETETVEEYGAAEADSTITMGVRLENVA
jgi:hypothetical protein